MALSLFIFFGAPGVGKGTLSRLCQERLSWRRIGAGDILRWHIDHKTTLGKKIAPQVARGELLSDEQVAEIIIAFLETIDSEKPCILDGFPRTQAQAEFLSAYLATRKDNSSVQLIHLNAEVETVVERMLSRLICSNKECGAVYSQKGEYAPQKAGVCDRCGHLLVQRCDDTRDSIMKRLQMYKAHEDEVISYYKKRGVQIVEISAKKTENSLFEEFCKITECFSV